MITMQPMNHLHAGESEYAAYASFANILRAERTPDLPPIPQAEQVNRLQNIPPFMGYSVWTLTADGRVIAALELAMPQTEENRHLAQCMIQVLLEQRRRGHGRTLLQQVAHLAQADGRRLIITTSYGAVPAGAAFLERLGAGRGLETHTNRLALHDVDRALLDEWLARGAALEDEFTLGLWVGRYPEEELEAIARLMDVMNQQPHGDLEVEDIQYTPARVREIEESRLAGGAEGWTLYARERQTGELAGYTAVYFQPNRPEQLSQGDTGVFPAYRRRGLGRWLKAAMMDKVLRERPEVRYVLTGNADSNAPMLKINYELGFRPYLSQTIWQIELEKVLAYLDVSAWAIDTAVSAQALQIAPAGKLSTRMPIASQQLSG